MEEVKSTYNNYCERCEIKQEKDSLVYFSQLNLFLCNKCGNKYLDIIEKVNLKFLKYKIND